MKNLMKWMMSIAVAAISLTGCENNFEEPTTVSNKFELTVTTDNLSRTEYDATLKDIKWSTGDQAQVFVNGSAQALAATIDVTDSRIASFTYSSTLGEGAALIQGFAPANAGEVSTTLVVVDDAWWGSWNYRGFNVGNGSALTDETADTACASFGIFVPKN